MTTPKEPSEAPTTPTPPTGTPPSQPGEQKTSAVPQPSTPVAPAPQPPSPISDLQPPVSSAKKTFVPKDNGEVEVVAVWAAPEDGVMLYRAVPTMSLDDYRLVTLAAWDKKTDKETSYRREDWESFDKPHNPTEEIRSMLRTPEDYTTGLWERGFVRKGVLSEYAKTQLSNAAHGLAIKGTQLNRLFTE